MPSYPILSCAVCPPIPSLTPSTPRWLTGRLRGCERDRRARNSQTTRSVVPGRGSHRSLVPQPSPAQPSWSMPCHPKPVIHPSVIHLPDPLSSYKSLRPEISHSPRSPRSLQWSRRARARCHEVDVIDPKVTRSTGAPHESSRPRNLADSARGRSLGSLSDPPVARLSLSPKLLTRPAHSPPGARDLRPFDCCRPDQRLLPPPCALMSGPKPATVEDCDSDSNDTLSEMYASRSPSKIRRHTAAAGAPASDSGYSSHAAATVASSGYDGDTLEKTMAAVAKESTGGHEPKRRSTHSSSRANRHERPYAMGPGAIPGSRSRSKARATVQEACECSQCIPRRRSVMDPLGTPWDLEYEPFDSQPRSRYVEIPMSSMARGYSRETPSMYPQRPRPQPLLSERPMSYHGGGSYAEEGYFADAYGPPPSLSAYTNPTISAPSYPIQSSYVPVSMPPTKAERFEALGYESVRPIAPRRATDRYATTRTGRPASMYGTPVIDYDYATPSTPYASTSSRRSKTKESEDPPRFSSQEAEDYYRMPPPSSKPSRRASLKQPSRSGSKREIPRSTPVAPVDSDADYTTERISRTKTSLTEEAPRSHSRRPGLSSGSHEYKSKSYSHEYPSSDRVGQVEVGSASHRRATYTGHEKTRNLERNAEEYQNATRATPLASYSEALPTKRRGRKTGSSSGSHSRRSSSREGSEAKSRPGSAVSLDVGDTEDSFTMRFSGAALKLDIGRGLDGRTILVKPGQAGPELSIGSASSGRYIDRMSDAELQYARSMPRRELDDVRSSRHTRSTSHSRRASQAGSTRQPSY